LGTGVPRSAKTSTSNNLSKAAHFGFAALVFLIFLKKKEEKSRKPECDDSTKNRFVVEGILEQSIELPCCMCMHIEYADAKQKRCMKCTPSNIIQCRRHIEDDNVRKVNLIAQCLTQFGNIRLSKG